MSDTTRANQLNARLRAVYRRELSLNVAMGAMTWVAWLVAVFLVAFAVDWLIHLPRGLRAIVFLALVGVPIHHAWRGGWRHVRPFSLLRSALRVEAHYKHFESLLSSGVQFHTRAIGSTGSVALTAHTVQQADRAAESVHAHEVITIAQARRPAGMSAGLLVLLVIITLINPTLVGAAAARLLTPWQNVAYPTRTQIAIDNEQIIVREGDGVHIGAALSGRVPGSAKLAIRTGEGEPRLRKLDVTDARCGHDMPAVYRSFDYAIHAGDARTEWHSVRVISAPKVVESRVQVAFPEYMQRPTEVIEAMTVTVPEGAQLEWQLKLDRPVRRAAFSIGAGKPVDATIGDDGLSVTHRVPATASESYVFKWVDEDHGFEFDTPRYYLQVMPDQPPRVELVSPARNLYATLDRQMLLTYRASDDHGIAETHLAFRRNDSPEQRVAIVAETESTTGSRQFDWKHRDAMAGLAEGDSVTIAIEVADRYPFDDGPHRMRSELRRVQFVAKDEYLAKTRQQRHRLLSQLRSAYRQERAAYEVVRNFDPADSAFEQMCLLESSRQDIIHEHLKTVVGRLQELVEDLNANRIDDPVEIGRITDVQQRLARIARDHVSRAAGRLRDLGPDASRDPGSVTSATQAINDAARELASLVIELGVSQAIEAFAMELHTITQLQHDLFVRTLDKPGAADLLADEQKALGQWVTRLHKELAAFDDYATQPLWVVRLIRRVKALAESDVAGRMHEAGAMLVEGEAGRAAAEQKSIIRLLTELDYGLRIGAERQALLNARAVLSMALDAMSSAGSPDRAALRGAHRSLRRLVVPQLPAPPVELLTKAPPDVPPVDAMLDAALGALAVVTDAQTIAPAQRQAAIEAIRSLDHALTVRLGHINQSADFAGRAGAALEQATLVRELLTSQYRVTEKTEDADYDDQSGAYLAPTQLRLADEAARLKRRLAAQATGSETSDAVIAPMLGMLTRAAAAMTQAAPALKAEQLTDAIDYQDEVLDALEAAVGFADQQSNTWVSLANLVMVSEDVAVPAGLMNDIVDEQRDLIEATLAATEQSRPRLTELQNCLTQAVYDVSGMLSGTGASLDFEQAAVFAGSDMGLSALKLEAGDVTQAVRAQRNAVTSVSDLRDRFASAQRRFDYLATAMRHVHRCYTDGVALSSRIGTGARAIESAEALNLADHRQSIEQMAADATRFSQSMVAATGKPVYADVEPTLAPALSAVDADDADACIDELLASADAFQAALAEMRDLMFRLSLVPTVDPIEAPPEYDILMEMIDLLLAQKGLATGVYRAEAQDVAGFAGAMRDLVDTASELRERTFGHKSMTASHRLMLEAIEQIEAAKRDKALELLYQCEAQLRHVVLEYVLNYIEPPKSGGGRRRKKAKSTTVSDFKLTLNMKKAFEKDYGGVEGDDPRAGRSEWQVLGRRDRAALNENFVRELPLEYRDLLKDYYERLSR